MKTKVFKIMLYLLFVSVMLYNSTYMNKCFVKGVFIPNRTESREEIPRKHVTRQVPWTITMDEVEKIQNKHIMRHVAWTIGKSEAENMNNSLFRFYFFQLHDENDDSLLDGIELMHAVIHFYDELSATENLSQDSTDKVIVYSDEMLARSVDKLLEAHDRDNDGFLDYSEFKADAPLIL